MADDALSVLRKYWKYNSFRPAQQEIIEAVVGGNDVVALLPTGAGKSICYQVPALMMKGVALVLSPLIALMRDQVAWLRRRGVAAAALHSGLSKTQQEDIIRLTEEGNIRLLYVAPERLHSSSFREWIQRLNISMVAIDEAHCISHWGHDFRPAYRKVARLREIHPNVPWIAVTATATDQTLTDIIQSLNLRSPRIFRGNPDRPNLVWGVRQVSAKHVKLLEVLRKVKGPSIVYLRSRKLTRRWAEYLRRAGIPAHYYHAGLTAAERNRRYHDWMRGTVRVMVATTAFGMGIDKPDVRTVIHLQLPDSIESYVQEAGRAGRDGQRAYAVIIYSNQDIQQLHHQVARDPLTYEDLRIVYDHLMMKLGIPYGHQPDRPLPFDMMELVRSLKRYSPRQLLDALMFMEELELLIYQGNLALPHRIRRKVSARELYDYQLKHPRFEVLLEYFLRVRPVPPKWTWISIDQISRATHLRPRSIRFQLEQLKSEGLIDFEATDYTDWIFFLSPRLPPEHFPVRPDIEKLLDHRRDIKFEKANQLVNFLTAPSCRNAVILRYFGEEKVPDRCDHCDVCLADSSSHSAPLGTILKMLGKESLTFEQLSARVPVADEVLLQTLRRLIDEKKIAQEEGRFYRTSS